MGKLSPAIIELSKTRRLVATVLEVTGSSATVSIKGISRHANIRVVGGPVSVGETVFIEWNGFEPIIQASSKQSGQIVNISSMPYSNIPQTGMWELGGWVVNQDGIISHDSGNYRINPAKPSLEMGTATDINSGIGVFLGKSAAANNTYSALIGDPNGQHLIFNGQTGALNITGSYTGLIVGTDNPSFTINQDRDNTNVNLVFGRTTGGDYTMNWDGTIFALNPNKLDQDFRISGDNQTNLFYVDASSDKIGIKDNTPYYDFDITGNLRVTGDIRLGTDEPSSTHIKASATTQELMFTSKNGHITTGWGHYINLPGSSGATSAVVAGGTSFGYGFATVQPIEASDTIYNNPSEMLVVRSSSKVPQVRFAYDGANYATIGVSSNGNMTLTPNGNLYFNPTGNYILPTTAYDLNIGMLSNKFLSLHAAELWVETLVAQDTLATIGGRIIVAPTTYLVQDFPASGTVLNPGFEIAGSGGSDVFADWIEVGSTITQDSSIKRSGLYSAKLTNTTGQCSITSAKISVIPNDFYTISFWEYGDGANYGQYAVWDATNENYIVPKTNVSSSSPQWSQQVVEITIPNGCIEISLILFSPLVEGLVYYDDVSIQPNTIYVKHNQMAADDIVLLQAGGKTEFMYVESDALGSGPYRYQVRRDLDESGANDWYAGDAVVNTGAPGDGFIDIYSAFGLRYGIGPTIVGNVRKNTDFNGWATVWALGNLNGLYGYGNNNLAGVAFGEYGHSNYITIDRTNGIRFFDSSGTVRGSLNTSAWVLGTADAQRIQILPSAINIYDADNIRRLVLNTNGVFLGGYEADSPYIVASSTAIGFWQKPGGALVGLINASDGSFYFGKSATQERLAWDTANGIRIFNPSNAPAFQVDTDGDFFLGSNISAVNTTYLSIFANAQAYNGEIMGVGNMLIGSNSSGRANILWDSSDSRLKFRGGTTTQAYVDTDGTIVTGDGDVKLNADGLSLTAGTISIPGPPPPPGWSKELRWTSGTDDIATIYAYKGTIEATNSLTIKCYDTVPTGSSMSLIAASIVLNASDVVYNYAATHVANFSPTTILDQGSNDGKILQFQSSDVDHGITNYAETDTYGYMQKISASEGGLYIGGLSESTETDALLLLGGAGAGDTTKSTAARAPVRLNAAKKSGTTLVSMGGNENLLTVENASTTKFIVDAEGDLHVDGSTTLSGYDDHDDISLIRGFELSLTRQALEESFRAWVEMQREKLIELGILSEGNFINATRLQRLQNGALWQLHQRLERIERALSL